MTEFTAEDIEHYRKQYAIWTSRRQTTPAELLLIDRLRDALDEIEHLQARVGELEIYNKNFHLACINALDLHRESDVPKLKDIPKIIEELRTRVQEIEMFQDLVNRWSDQYYRDTNKLKQRIAELEEALAKIANYESMRFRLSPYEYGVLEQIVGIAEHALR